MSKHIAAAKALKILKVLLKISVKNLGMVKFTSKFQAVPNENGKSTSLNPASLPFVPGVPVAASVTTSSKSSASANPEVDDDLKSPISLVHESALKRSLPVTFEVKRESGPAHMKTFVTKCSVGEFLTEGEGNGKKVMTNLRISH